MHIPNHRSAELNGFLKFPHVSVIFVRELRMVQFCLLLCTNVIKQIREPQPQLIYRLKWTSLLPITLQYLNYQNYFLLPQVTFEGVVGNDYRGDIAIDDFPLTAGSCAFSK